MSCGRLVAAYVDDGQGRRLVVARAEERAFNETLVLALTQEEARAAIRTLYQLLEELPKETEAREKPPIAL
jgi:hypothetical protein